MSATAVEEQLTTQQAEQVAEVAVEPEAMSAGPTVAEVAAPVPESEIPAVETAAPVKAPETASEQAYGHELTTEDRESLIATTEHRIHQALQPFTLACSNRKTELRALASNPKLIATLGKIAFGDLLPGVARGNPLSGVGLPDKAAKLVSSTALKPGKMKKSLEKINKIPMLNFNINYPSFVDSETDEEFVDALADSAMSANEAMRVGLEGRSNEDLASLCAAFDPKANATSVFEDHIDMAIAKIAGHSKAKEVEEIEKQVPAIQAAAAGGDPKDGRHHHADQAATEKVDGEKHDKTPKTAEQQQVVETMPDEMRELYDDRAYTQRV